MERNYSSSGNFHFAPPKNDSLTLEQALSDLHRRIGQRLRLAAGMSCLDLGCGIGGVMRDLAPTQATLVGITIAANEVEIGNNELRKLGIDSNCRLIEGDCHDMPLDNASYDAAYAVYSLKYFPQLDGVMKEVSRVLKRGGRFLVYDLIKTEKYDPSNESHAEIPLRFHKDLFILCDSSDKSDESAAIVEGLEYACGMPSLHTRAEMLAAAERYGLTLEEEEDLAIINGNPFHYCFSHSPTFMWLVESPFIKSLVSVAQKLRILPQGFHNFNKIFLSGTVEKIVNGGRLGILYGLTLEEEEDLAVINGNPFHYCFSHSPTFMWLVESPFIKSLVSVAQKLRILPQGFHNFNKVFLSGTVEKIVNGGRLGILSGSKIFVFTKRN
ncbi:unnamed protein product [Heligmosomoides polygyrus]|uniref:SAM_MT_ERG6_SMT domain-containing protein n=1 Tax=Heligmosomoides polygyrus TaxID=6339 RepID=A0A183FSJ0_HELPZ|nr:unnamed protein product [Heligmosomoides polygyrus]